MAKARSRRTLRNRKSRNRRGGVFRFFISDDKKAFKEAPDKCNYIVELVNNSPDKLPNLYQELNEHDKNTLHACIVNGLVNNSIQEQNIRDLLPTGNETKKMIVSEAMQQRKKQQEERAQQEKRAQQQERAPQEHQEGRAPQASDNVFIHNIPPGGPGGFYKPKPIKPLPTNVEAFQEQFNAKLDAPSPQNAGKSRRRHRRGRTLHKIRKSRKVRKTRCRRGRK